MHPGVGLAGWLRWLAHPFRDIECRGHEQYPALDPDNLFLLPASQKWLLGFLVFL